MAQVGRQLDSTTQSATVLMPMQFLTTDQGMFMAVLGALTGVYYPPTPPIDSFITNLSQLTLIQGMGVVLAMQSTTLVYSDQVAMGSMLTSST